MLPSPHQSLEHILCLLALTLDQCPKRKMSEIDCSFVISSIVTTSLSITRPLTESTIHQYEFLNHPIHGFIFYFM